MWESGIVVGRRVDGVDVIPMVVAGIWEKEEEPRVGRGATMVV